MGQNSHGYSDYLTVLEDGRDGIAKLLSTNREFIDGRRMTTGSGVQEYQLSSTLMPFEGNTEGAREFSQELIKMYEEKELLRPEKCWPGSPGRPRRQNKHCLHQTRRPPWSTARLRWSNTSAQ